MRKPVAVAVLLGCAVSALGQGGPAPCTSNTPDGVPCLDPALGVVVRFGPPIPAEKLAPPPPPSASVDIPKLQTSPKSAAPPLTGYSQYWTYERDHAFYHDGDTVQEMSPETLQSHSGSREQFDTSYRAGEAIGGAVGALVRAWVAHHQRVVEERQGLRQQLSAYYNATFDLTDEMMRYQDTLAADYGLLAGLDPPRRSIYEKGAENAAVFKARYAAMRPTGEKMLRQILATKKVKYLGSDVALAEKTYQAARDDAEREDVFVRFVGGLAGYFAARQAAPPASGRGASPPSSGTKAPQAGQAALDWDPFGGRELSSISIEDCSERAKDVLTELLSAEADMDPPYDMPHGGFLMTDPGGIPPLWRLARVEAVASRCVELSQKFYPAHQEPISGSLAVLDVAARGALRFLAACNPYLDEGMDDVAACERLGDEGFVEKAERFVHEVNPETVTTKELLPYLQTSGTYLTVCAIKARDRGRFALAERLRSVDGGLAHLASVAVTQPR